MLSLLSSRGSANCATYSSVHHSSGTISVRSLLLFYSQILGDYDTLVAEYVSEGNYRAAIGSLWVLFYFYYFFIKNYAIIQHLKFKKKFNFFSSF